MVEATVEEIAGYISGNVKRKQILDVLDKNGSATSEYLGKLTRIPRLMLENVLKDMMEKGVIVKQEGNYTLTENAKTAATTLPKGSSKSGGHKYDANIKHDI